MTRRLMAVLTLALVAIGSWLAWGVLREIEPQQVVRSLAQLQSHRLALAGLFVAASYAVLTGFDAIGVRYAGRTLPYRRIALTSFVSLSLGHTIGLAPFSSGAVRYRFYTRYGLDAFAVARIALLSGVTVGVGELALGAITLLAFPSLAGRILQIEPGLARLLGIAAVALLALYVGLAARVRRPLRLGRWSVGLPGWRLALAQIAVGLVNYALVSAALQQTLSSSAPLDYPTVAAAFILANLATVISHVPGGLGVIESVIIRLLPHADVLGGVVAFRVLYFFVPFAIGALLFGLIELRLRLTGHRAGGVAASRPATGHAG